MIGAIEKLGDAKGPDMRIKLTKITRPSPYTVNSHVVRIGQRSTARCSARTHGGNRLTGSPSTTRTTGAIVSGGWSTLTGVVVFIDVHLSNHKCQVGCRAGTAHIKSRTVKDKVVFPSLFRMGYGIAKVRNTASVPTSSVKTLGLPECRANRQHDD